MRGFGAFTLRRRGLVAAALIAALAASAWALPRFALEFTFEALVDAPTDARREIAEVEAAMPTPPVFAVVTLTWPRAIGSAEISAVARVEAALRELDGVAEVTSPASVQVAATDGPIPRPVAFATRVAQIEQTEQNEQGPALAAAREHPLLFGRLISRDGRSAALVVIADQTDQPPQPAASPSGELLAQVQARVAETAPSDVTARVLGDAIVESAMGAAMYGDMMQSLLLQTLCCLLVLTLLFRSARGVVIPLLVVIASLLAFCGASVALGWSLSVIEVTVPGLIIIIGLCDAIHMLHRFEEARRRGRDRRAAIIEMMDAVGAACLFTSLTTAIGFLSLLVASHSAVRDFAVSAALGVAIAFAVVVTAVPLLLSVWPGLDADADGNAAAETAAETAAEPKPAARAVRLSYTRPRLTAAVMALVLALSVWGATRLEVQSRWLEELPADHPATADVGWYQRHFEGLLRLEVELRGDLRDPAAFRAVSQFQAAMVAEPGVRGAESYIDWVHELLGHRTDAPLSDADIARGAALLSALSALDDRFPAHIVTRDLSRARLRFRTLDVGTRRYGELLARADALARALPPSVRASVGGAARLNYDSTQELIATTLQSLLVSLAMIALLVAALFRSLRIGLISLIPNAVPVIAALGLAGWLGIPLRLGIIMIFGLGVGLAVDNSIHLIARYHQERAARPDAPTRALLLTSLRTSGRALIITAVVLALGAMCYLPAAFRSLAEIGILLTTIVIAALLANLFALPHLLERWDRR